MGSAPYCRDQRWHKRRDDGGGGRGRGSNLGRFGRGRSSRSTTKEEFEATQDINMGETPVMFPSLFGMAAIAGPSTFNSNTLDFS